MQLQACKQSSIRHSPVYIKPENIKAKTQVFFDK